MEKVAKFEKVDEQVFVDDMTASLFDMFDIDAEEIYEKLKKPSKDDENAVAYDFYAPVDIHLEPGQTIKIPTGFKINLKDGYALLIFPKRKLADRFSLRLANTLSVIDGKAHKESDGHIVVKLVNSSSENKTVDIRQGDAFVQGIIVKCGAAE